MNRLNIIAIASLSFCAVATANAETISEVADFKSIADYVEPQAQPEHMRPVTFIEDDNYYLQLSPDHKSIIKYETKTGKEVEAVFKVDYTRETTLSSIQGFILSPEESKIMVWTDEQEQYRHSYSAKYYVYERRSRLLTPLSEERERQQSPVFSPDGRMVAYVSGNNIFLKKLDYGTDIAVTKDGEVNKIINGVPDWTYQEEFSTTCSMTWSPDNMMLCYLKYDETDVPTYSFPLYEGDCPEMADYELYPGTFSYKYPVAGQKNSVVTLHSYNIETRKTIALSLPDKRIEYIPRIMYGPTAEQLIAVGLNREQNRMEVYSVNPKSNVAKSLLVETSNAWIAPDSYEKIRLLPDFFVIASSRTGYQHFYKYSYNGALMGAITTGDYDVTDYYGYDRARATHFYQSTATGAINRVISSIDAKQRVTQLTPAEGYASATFSPTMHYYFVSYSNVTTAPAYTLYAATSPKPVRTILDNSEYMKRYSSTPKPEFFTMTSDGVTLNGYMIKPAGFTPSGKYPVIMNQYSGPGSQEVLNKWSVSWANYFAEQGYVIITVDGRGTGGRGRKFMDAVYKNLGHYESIDQLAAARYAASLPYVDANRIGIYGWSYGGYETIMAVSQNNAPYAAAVAVAPVTDWRFYDTVYAERYMLTPEQNASGYKSSSCLSIAGQRTCPLLIITGTADDNVHFYNTVHYTTKVEQLDKWTDLMIVPNANHFIRGCGKRSLVYSRMLDYFNRNMK